MAEAEDKSFFWAKFKQTRMSCVWVSIQLFPLLSLSYLLRVYLSVHGKHLMLPCYYNGAKAKWNEIISYDIILSYPKFHLERFFVYVLRKLFQIMRSKFFAMSHNIVILFQEVLRLTHNLSFTSKNPNNTVYVFGLHSYFHCPFKFY